VSLLIEEDTYESTVLILAVDLSNPWSIMDDLERWLEIFRRAMTKVTWLNEHRLREGKKRGRLWINVILAVKLTYLSI
jgi:nitrate reductase assembly molybdenum cofactor insertion protein NarJ